MILFFAVAQAQRHYGSAIHFNKSLQIFLVLLLKSDRIDNALWTTVEKWTPRRGDDASSVFEYYSAGSDHVVKDRFRESLWGWFSVWVLDDAQSTWSTPEIEWDILSWLNPTQFHWQSHCRCCAPCLTPIDIMQSNIRYSFAFQTNRNDIRNGTATDVGGF